MPFTWGSVADWNDLATWDGGEIPEDETGTGEGEPTVIRVLWAIDGYPVPLIWRDVHLEAPGGFGSMGEASCRERDFPASAGIFSQVRGVRSDGRDFYVGEIAGPPRVSSGRVWLSVQGLREAIARRRGRRLYMTRDLSQFALSDADPFALGGYQMNDNYLITISDGAITFTVTPATYAVNDRASVSMWVPGETITRLAFSIARVVSNTNFEIQLCTGAGPSGGVTTEATTYDLTGTSTINVDHTLTNPNDMVQIRILCTGATTPAVNKRAILRNIRVNGRSLDDTFTLSDLSADIASEFQWDDLSPATTETILPQDWFEDWAGAMTAAAALGDQTWLCLGPETFSRNAGGLYMGDWGRSSYAVRDADYADLQPTTVYNAVTVAYTSPTGVQRTVTVTADPDPYVLRGLEVVWPPDGPYQLDARQLDADAATAAAYHFLNYWSVPHVTGQVRVGRVWAPDGPTHPWDVDPGDLVTLAGYLSYASGVPVEIGAQRVVEIIRHGDGTATLGFTAQTSAPALIASAARRRGGTNPTGRPWADVRQGALGR